MLYGKGRTHGFVISCMQSCQAENKLVLVLALVIPPKKDSDTWLSDTACPQLHGHMRARVRGDAVVSGPRVWAACQDSTT